MTVKDRPYIYWLEGFPVLVRPGERIIATITRNEDQRTGDASATTTIWHENTNGGKRKLWERSLPPYDL